MKPTTEQQALIGAVIKRAEQACDSVESGVNFYDPSRETIVYHISRCKQLIRACVDIHIEDDLPRKFTATEHKQLGDMAEFCASSVRESIAAKSRATEQRIFSKFGVGKCFVYLENVMSVSKHVPYSPHSNAGSTVYLEQLPALNAEYHDSSGVIREKVFSGQQFWALDKTP
jgi:hypothetical protein